MGISLTLLTLAWSMTSLPFSAPDEAPHYLRALSIANGNLLGPHVRYPVGGFTPLAEAFVQADTRGVLTPARLSPLDVTCVNGRPDTGPGRCVEATPTGDYYPLGYLAPAVAIGLSRNVGTASWVGRVASAAVATAFIVLALMLLWSGTGWSLLGPSLAITPMVLFVDSVINPSGLEIAACLAFAAAILRVARDPDGPPRWVWASAALSGTAAILAWQAGPAFVAADLVLLAGLVGRAGLRRLFRSRRIEVVGVVTALLAAVVTYAAYAGISGVAHTPFGIHPVIASLHAGVDQLPQILRGAVGSFASLTIDLPTWAYWLWWLLALGLGIISLWLGTARERVMLAAAVAFALIFPVLSYAWVQRHSGFGMQGRYVLPVLMLVPLLAGEILRRRMEDYGTHSVAVWTARAGFTLVALFQAYAWWTNARISSGNPSAVSFYAHAAWVPPLGWLPWILIAALGALGLVACAAIPLNREVSLSEPSFAKPTPIDAYVM